MTRGLSSPINLRQFSDLGHLYTNFMGSPPEKTFVYQQYRYSIVIENSQSYISEKLFDVIVAGSVPIYVGPKLEEFSIPSEIALEAIPDLDCIRDKISHLRSNPNLVERLRVAGQEFLHSSRFSKMKNETVLRDLARKVVEKIELLS